MVNEACRCTRRTPHLLERVLTANFRIDSRIANTMLDSTPRKHIDITMKRPEMLQSFVPDRFVGVCWQHRPNLPIAVTRVSNQRFVHMQAIISSEDTIVDNNKYSGDRRTRIEMNTTSKKDRKTPQDISDSTKTWRRIRTHTRYQLTQN